MTIKELAKFAGKTEKTIQNWVAKCNEKITLHNEKITLVKGQETNLSIDQVELVLNAGTMSKDAVTILMQNARQSTAIAPIQNNLEMVKMMSDIMAQSMATALKPLYDRLDRIENQTPKTVITTRSAKRRAKGLFK
jgi:predicted transcriptional regulator